MLHVINCLFGFLSVLGCPLTPLIYNGCFIRYREHAKVSWLHSHCLPVCLCVRDREGERGRDSFFLLFYSFAWGQISFIWKIILDVFSLWKACDWGSLWLFLILWELLINLVLNWWHASEVHCRKLHITCVWGLRDPSCKPWLNTTDFHMFCICYQCLTFFL